MRLPLCVFFWSPPGDLCPTRVSRGGFLAVSFQARGGECGARFTDRGGCSFDSISLDVPRIFRGQWSRKAACFRQFGPRLSVRAASNRLGGFLIVRPDPRFTVKRAPRHGDGAPHFTVKWVPP